MLGRCLIIAVAAIELLVDGFRIPWIGFEILTGQDQYAGTTGWTNNAFKFWLSVIKILALPLAAVMCLGPRPVARIGAGLALLTFLAWWISATFEEFDDLRRLADPDPMTAAWGSVRLFLPTAPLLIAAFVWLRGRPLGPRPAWLMAMFMILCTAGSLFLFLPLLSSVGGNPYAPQGLTLYVVLFLGVLVIATALAILMAFRAPQDPEQTL